MMFQIKTGFVVRGSNFVTTVISGTLGQNASQQSCKSSLANDTLSLLKN